MKRRILLAPVISALAILVSFLSPFVSVLMYALLPPFYILPGASIVTSFVAEPNL